MNLIDHHDIEIQIVVSYNLVCWFLKGQEWGPDQGPDQGPEWDPEWGPDWGPEWNPEKGVHVLSTPQVMMGIARLEPKIGQLAQ